MKKILASMVAGLFLFGPMSAGFAGQKVGQGSKEEAKVMIERAAQWYKQYGREKTLAEITRAGTEKRGEFIDRDLYIFAYDFNGVNVAHGSNPKLIGRDLIDMQDADGRYLIRGLIETARKGSGWYYYKWSNPISKKIEDKIAYVLKLDDGLWIGAGVYGKEAQVKKIGVLIMFEESRYHEALQGMREQLDREGFGEPATTFIMENAMGSRVKAADLIRKFAEARVDLILTLGTVGTLAVTKEIKDIPVVFSVVYDPVDAGIARKLESSGNNTTGTTTHVPMSVLLQKLKEFAPVKKLAVLYTPGEKNSEAQLKELQKLQTNSPMKIVAVPLTRKEEVAEIMMEVVHTADAIYLTGSSIIGSTTPIIVDMANKAKVVTITHLEDMVDKGVLMGVCANSYSEGLLAGAKAAKILQGAAPSSIPIELPKKIDVIFNLKSAQAGQFQVPSNFMKNVTRTVE
ncbi:MAG: cache domain-containing protein [Nitrospirae bacterium]|nr:cache domain-containing protein [Nitrospirota bacterium]